MAVEKKGSTTAATATKEEVVVTPTAVPPIGIAVPTNGGAEDMSKRVLLNMQQNTTGIEGTKMQFRISIKALHEKIKSLVTGDCIVDSTEDTINDVAKLLVKYDPPTKEMILASIFANGALKFTTRLIINQAGYLRKLTPQENPDALISDQYALDINKIRNNFGAILPTDKKGEPAIIFITPPDGRIELYVDIFKVLYTLSDRVKMSLDGSDITNGRKIGKKQGDYKMNIGYTDLGNIVDSRITVEKFI